VSIGKTIFKIFPFFPCSYKKREWPDHHSRSGWSAKTCMVGLALINDYEIIMGLLFSEIKR